MSIRSVKKSWGNNKTINYVGKDFGQLRQNLIDFTRAYFPDTYSDFNESSPGMVFIEMAAYIGDVLSFYQDVQLKESILTHASERKNVVALAQAMGYKPKVTTPAVTNLTVYQLVPSSGSGDANAPDPNFFLKIKDGMEVSSITNSSVIFRTTDSIDFADPVDREISVYSRNESTGQPDFYLITKKAQAISATEKEATYIIPTDAINYPFITLSDTNIIDIVSIREQDTNERYYQVPYLAQESIFVEKPNTNVNGQFGQYVQSVPYILEVQKVPKRFSIKVNSNNTFDIQFGSGDVNLNDDIVLPNSKNIGLGTSNSINRLLSSIDPSNFLKTSTFGVAPAGKTLVVKYLVGGGVESNVNTGDLTTIRRIEYEEDLVSITDQTFYETIKQSVAVENLEPAVGGRGAETVEEIRQNALATFGSQNRAVTRQDYVVRALSMPERYGSVAKVYVSPDSEIDSNDTQAILSNSKNLLELTNLVERLNGLSRSEVQSELNTFLTNKRTATTLTNNPFAINMYVLSYDVNKKLTNTNPAVKQNLKTYLGEYRILTDAVNILDGYIVNIGLDFEIICYPNFNKREVLAKCLTEMQDYFNIDNWTFNKPVNISEIELILANVEGVLSVPKVEVFNLYGTDGNYSTNRYNIPQATVGKIIYPSLDPCIFEVKYPNKDIKGRAL
ncbi:hypothetical protein UFOVP449_68 [uncultured Caudovirales phage]|uniref:Baseplate wedge subunit n=1 Tax=uncultured Caudovirales phage TaxID=2100421 RepID=A0A6J5MBI7_9CAUD|nr:hypothetical protein UFOVP449_68 [uncultured Caudovirales phage]